MRAYLPVSWEQLAELDTTGELAPPRSVFAVDPGWRAGAPDVDEEQWEYEAQLLAAEALPEDGGAVLAVDLDPGPEDVVTDGALVVVVPVSRRRVAAVLDADLSWYAVQEIAVLLAARRPS